MTEEELANRFALRQMGFFQEDEHHDDYHRIRSSQVSFDRDNHAAVVSMIAKKIARAAFRSEEGSGYTHRLKDTGSGLWDFLKSTFRKPGVREGLIIASVMVFKMGLFFSYRRASSEGLEIIDL